MNDIAIFSLNGILLLHVLKTISACSNRHYSFLYGRTCLMREGVPQVRELLRNIFEKLKPIFNCSMVESFFHNWRLWSFRYLHYLGYCYELKFLDLLPFSNFSPRSLGLVLRAGLRQLMITISFKFWFIAPHGFPRETPLDFDCFQTATQISGGKVC